MAEFKAKIKAKNQKAASSLPKFPMPYKVKKAKKGKIMEKPKKDVSLALSKRIGKSRGAPPKKGPTPQGLKIGALSNIGCPHRENGVQGSDIKGVKPIQTTGKKFIGVK